MSDTTNTKEFKGSTDIPLTDQTKDKLAIAPFASGLANFVLTCETPMTIAVQGEWGSGKTSLMKLVEQKIKDSDIRTNVLSHWFDAWQYGATGDADVLGLRLLSDLAGSLQAASDADNMAVHRATQTLMRGLKSMVPAVSKAVVAGAAGTVSGGVINGDALAKGLFGESGSTDIGGIREAFQTIVKGVVERPSGNRGRMGESGRGRVVVFVDDLDRIRPGRAVALLEILKNFMDVSDTVFVVACDYAVVREGVRELMGIEDPSKVEAFFHKIFQVPFRMPVSAYSVEPLLFEWLENKLGKLNGGTGELVKLTAPLIESALGTNPRAFKRYLNTVDLHCAVDAAYAVKPAASADPSQCRVQNWANDPKLGKPQAWVCSLLGLFALEMAWPTVAAHIHHDLLANADKQMAAHDFERALRTLANNWKGWQATADGDADESPDEGTLSAVLRSEAFAGKRSWRDTSAGERIAAFAEQWLSALDTDRGQNAEHDHLSVNETRFLWQWSRRSASQVNQSVARRGKLKFTHETREADPVHGDAFIGVAQSAYEWGKAADHYDAVFDQGGVQVRLAKQPKGQVRLLRFERNGACLHMRVAWHDNLDELVGIDGVRARVIEFGESLRDCGMEGVVMHNYHGVDFAQSHRDGDAKQLEQVLQACRTLLETVARLPRRLEVLAVEGVSDEKNLQSPESVAFSKG